ncbi:glycoside hydrolase family 2 protein [Enterococcus timonensis]|uniref:glycoside hydrolase family 2 protein n=1 Tax=Enterococcus timonensis TaxID=1852364 RepID=UPI0008DA6B9A|nr:glycoside hydrolase family 2 [Enterococcus timonensis]
MNIRNEYPRPQLVRDNWQNLNGEWDFFFDDENRGVKEKIYFSGEEFNQKILVPFAYQTEKSGIGVTDQHDIVWYRKHINLIKKGNNRYILHFGAVDYYSDIYMNGQLVMHHEGGNTSFSVDVTDSLFVEGQNTLIVRVCDPQLDESILRGKQIWEQKSKGIWYTNTTGIWQTVWMEEVPNSYITKLKVTPLFDENKVEIIVELNKNCKNSRLNYQIFFKEKTICDGSCNFDGRKVKLQVDVLGEKIFQTNFHGDGWSWTPENPNLFDIVLTVTNEEEIPFDIIKSYFGFRKIHQEQGMTYLNNRPYYQKLVLDQGYWPESLLTAPDDDAFKKDIELAKDMGFNGCRKHQKTEDPRFLYWADHLGYLVWEECASAPIFNTDAVNHLINEWKEIVERDYNHPCIVTWVPLNESWGIPNIQRNREQQHFSQTMYHYIHSLDPTRLVVSNDGWSMTETDICAIHNYSHGNLNETKKYEFFKESLNSRENILRFPSTSWDIYANGFENHGEPMMLTEFGGIGFEVGNQKGWGYTSVSSSVEFISEYQRIMDAVYSSKGLWGFCYTQLTDVEQEINGILTYDRKPKCSLDKIKEINDAYHVARI